jgi:formate dehydrogenase iron-sulfur subunit
VSRCQDYREHVSDAVAQLRESRALEVVASHTEVPGGLLPALHALQHEFGFVDRSLIPELASAFNLSTAEVHGVVSFYRDFRTAPPSGPIVQICGAEACQARRCGAVVERAEQMVAAGAAVELVETFCLGNCALGPSVAVDGVVHGRVDPAGVEVLIDRAVLGATIPPASHAPGTATTTLYVSGDSAARSVGADDVADAFVATGRVSVVRNGSRGMLWLEPMIEVSTPAGRVAYGPVTAGDVPDLLAAGALDGADHPLRLGPIEELAWLQRQQRVTFARVGVIDPVSADDYERHGGVTGLRAALATTPDAVISAVTDSGLRGRGGAAFPTGIKWRTVADAAGLQKYVVCNADEGDSGTFADRMLIEGDPFSLIEGMTIAGYAVGATRGYVYLRSEYPAAADVFRSALVIAEQRGWLGRDVLGSGFEFTIELRIGAGAYICGEETAMLESLEGRRGVVRAKPPLPAIEGLFGLPTVVNNVLTLATVPMVLADGAAAYAAYGSGRSRGTQVFQLAGNVARGGIVEVPFGITLRALIEDFGGGTASGRPVKAAQVGGPLGAYLAPSKFDMELDYEVFAAAGALVGHGGIVVFDDTANMADQARFAMEFCAEESCGKCTPCRIGSTRGVELIDKITAGVDRTANLQLLDELCEVMTDASLCAMGGLTPLPVRSCVEQFPDDFLGATPNAMEGQS